MIPVVLKKAVLANQSKCWHIRSYLTQHAMNGPYETLFYVVHHPSVWDIDEYLCIPAQVILSNMQQIKMTFIWLILYFKKFFMWEEFQRCSDKSWCLETNFASLSTIVCYYCPSKNTVCVNSIESRQSVDISSQILNQKDFEHEIANDSMSDD